MTIRLIAFFLTLVATSVKADDVEVVKDGVKSVVSGIIASGKDALSGLKDGVDDGRQSGSSIDGAIIVTDKDKLVKYVTAEVLSVEKVATQAFKVTLSLRNNTDKIIRLSNLSEDKALLLIDEQGYVSSMKKDKAAGVTDITIPENAAIKVRYTFEGVECNPSVLRLYGLAIPIPSVKAE